MDGFAIGEQHHSTIAPLALRDQRPSPDAAVGLDDLTQRRRDGALDLRVEDATPAGAGSHRNEILRVCPLARATRSECCRRLRAPLESRRFQCLCRYAPSRTSSGSHARRQWRNVRMMTREPSTR